MKHKAKDQILFRDGRTMTLAEALNKKILHVKEERYYDPPRYFATDGKESWEIGKTFYLSRSGKTLPF